MKLPIVDPSVPPPHREVVEGANVELASLPLFADAPVLGLACGVGEDQAGIEDRAPVWTPGRESRAGVNGRGADRLAAVHDIEDIDLIILVVVAPGHERQAAA